MTKHLGEYAVQRYITARRSAVYHHHQLTSINFDLGWSCTSRLGKRNRTTDALRLIKAERMAGRPAADKAQSRKQTKEVKGAWMKGKGGKQG